ncbi:SPOR domain-containing protein [Thioclava sp. GXIMD4216]|uniref:SPOR domain-containing protein n=1 Tax=Thioclava sp. GXIMD4216 TaxID=3131929 RepID=UPI0030CA992A
MHRRRLSPVILMLGAGLSLAACQTTGLPFGKSKTEDGAVTEQTSARLVERDVEAPQVFSVEEQGLWDGRPSLGGVWVAHPTVKDPERVIIRNTENGKFVIGALFRRERENPGPKLQVSSDAADALGMLAGAPAKLSVVALRRQEAAPEGTDPAPEAEVVAASDAMTPETITTGALPAQTPAKAPPAPQGSGKPAAKPAAKPAPKAASKPPAAQAASVQPSAAKPGGLLVQIGIFSVKANAESATAKLGKSGVVAQTIEENWQGKKFWRVVAGPAASQSDRNTLLTKIKGLGFTDAFAVSK